MSRIRVRDIMRTDHPVLSPETPMRRAVATLVEARTSAAPVLDETGRLAGLLTQKDCFRPALQAGYHAEWTGRVADHMTRAVMTIDAEEEIVVAAETFLQRAHRVLPVTDAAGLCGMLHRSDVLAALLRAG
ncbi:CBS domain-containing protein [Wenxinia marina]|uniref:CBS-domain-containing membrane protein n=1 Tax=Wenxinia marina DSM 24838 TaxID=1123501 RepID=A0A0D0Q9X6_9RHOB|nr:CBS domain-containing protein [Wenxinia marina]KIQ71209.1 CBS-domain-containing membrane protein [Wenxinia marina DSM 24838]GGL81613.1 hypothetical protein GCM10011392_40290 [Wenxinia marina]